MSRNLAIRDDFVFSYTFIMLYFFCTVAILGYADFRFYLKTYLKKGLLDFRLFLGLFIRP